MASVLIQQNNHHMNEDMINLSQNYSNSKTECQQFCSSFSEPISVFLSLIPENEHTIKIDPVTKLMLDSSRSVGSTSILTIASNLARFVEAFVEDALIVHQPDGKSLIEPIEPKIRQMFTFIGQHAYFQMAEYLLAAYYVCRLVQVHRSLTKSDPTSPVVSSHNIGTVLVVSLMLAGKVNQDRPLRNSWWAKAFGIPLDLLNDSEEYFLKHLDYQLAPADNMLSSLFSYFGEA
ncbi:hypothetical protein BLNAU_18261 [Blattamonas nauphoetae]|uniref:Cyclin N-terminal domain-containing protein n=1 Tax=Blattamonas nauphoetae TaxID=2049346 RepID=A0ABQ9X5E3_9EUKA|nr:hypothetical protein BLNAU_18261 [Blattamonas nauphoetae]